MKRASTRWCFGLASAAPTSRAKHRHFVRFSTLSKDDDPHAADSDGNDKTETSTTDLSAQISELEDLNDAFASDQTEEWKRKALKVEYDYLSYVGEPVPSTVTEKMTRILIDQTSSEYRKNTWAYFHSVEEHKVSKRDLLKRRALHRTRTIEKITRERLKGDFDGVLYDEHGVSVAGPPQVIVPKVDPSHVIKRQNHNVKFALDFGQSLVLDMGLSSNSTNPKSIRDMQRQVHGLYSINRTHHEPFNIHLCNFSERSPAHRGLVESSPSSDHLWNVSSQCLTSIFPRKRILYLSDRAAGFWTDYKHDDVIVMGAYGRGDSPDHAALVKKYNLRTARLNIAPFFVNRHPPCFSLIDMMQIILDARDTNGDWLYAFRRLGGRSSAVEWKPRYHFMKAHSEEIERDGRTPEQLLTKAKERVYVNERTIFKSHSALLCYDTGSC